MYISMLFGTGRLRLRGTSNEGVKRIAVEMAMTRGVSESHPKLTQPPRRMGMVVVVVTMEVEKSSRFLYLAQSG